MPNAITGVVYEYAKESIRIRRLRSRLRFSGIHSTIMVLLSVFYEHLDYISIAAEAGK